MATTSRPKAILVCILLCSFAALTALANAPADEPYSSRLTTTDTTRHAQQEILRLVDQLADDEYLVRQTALQKLLAKHAETLHKLVTTRDLQLETLTDEQRLRIESILRHVFDRSPRGGMGIAFNMQNFQGPGVEIARAIKGFDAHRKFRTGDMILEIDGIPIGRTPSGTNLIRSIILSHKPNDTLSVLIRRDRKKLRVHVQLRHQAMLRNRQGPTVFELNNAWAIRRARLGFGRQNNTLRPVLQQAPNTISRPTHQSKNPVQLQAAGSALPPSGVSTQQPAKR